MLDTVDLVRVGEEEIGAELAFLDAIVGESLVPEELVHLAELFVEGHLAEQGVDLGVDRSVVRSGRRKRCLLGD